MGLRAPGDSLCGSTNPAAQFRLIMMATHRPTAAKVTSIISDHRWTRVASTSRDRQLPFHKHESIVPNTSIDYSKTAKRVNDQCPSPPHKIRRNQATKSTSP